MSKQELKGEMVDKYEKVLVPKGDLSWNVDSFWSCFFSITPKIHVLEWKLLKSTQDYPLASIRPRLQLLFDKCIATLGLWYEEEEKSRHIKVFHALYTLAGFFRCVYKKQNQGPDLINLFMGLDGVESKTRSCISHICHFLSFEESPKILKDVCLNILLILSCGEDRVSENGVLEFLVAGEGEALFSILVHLLNDDEFDESHRYTAVLLLTILVQYRKNESENPLTMRLSLLDEEVALSAYSRVITSSLSSLVSRCEVKLGGSENEGWLTYLVGSMFLNENRGSGGVGTELLSSQNPVLLAMYEAIHLNRNFIASLTHYSNNVDNETPSNLLATFLEFSSIVMLDIKKGDWSHETLRLNFIILLCVTEDQYANVLMHDPNLVFRVKLHSSNQNRYQTGAEAKPLAASILDLCVRFIGTNVKKLNFLSDLYFQVLSIVHRLLSYEKRSKTRLRYPWEDLWKVLMDLLDTISKESNNPSEDYYSLALKAVTVFNLFITYGDTFLPSPSTYDELYYEVTRRSEIFNKLYQKACSYSSKGGKYKEGAVRLTNGLVNIRAITSHFKHIIEAWLKSEELSTPTPEQTLEVVKSNYESLTLKLQDGLDAYERYSESPVYSRFFYGLVQAVIKDTKANKIILKDLQPREVIQIFSSLTKEHI